MNSYVLISGASGGLGKAFAAECAARGWDLFLTDISEEALEKVASGLERMYEVKVLYQACDLTDADAREDLWVRIGQLGLEFHFLINVAGLDFQGLFEDRRVSELQTILRVNIESTVEMTRRVLQFKHPLQRLYIINVSSLAAFYPMPVKAVYAASKRFLLDWSLALHQELSDSGVTVTALCPAGMPTNADCIRAIDAQGTLGRVTTLNVGDVAARTLDRALSGRSVYVPGTVNQVLRRLGSLAPAPLVAFLIDKRWRKSHAQSHGHGPTVQALSPSA